MKYSLIVILYKRIDAMSGVYIHIPIQNAYECMYAHTYIHTPDIASILLYKITIKLYFIIKQ